MPGEHYRHIFLEGPTRTPGFTRPPGGGDSKTQIFPRDPASHSAYLKQQFLNAWAEAEAQQRRAVTHVERCGAYIEFESEPGYELIVQSLEAISSKIRLLNVRTEGEAEAQRTLATIFVPNEKRGHFLRKILKYATEIDRRSDLPKNIKLINNISDIHHAILKSFWRADECPLIPDDNPEWVEVWVRSEQDNQSAIIANTEELLETLQIESSEGVLRFPERSVKLIHANRSQLEQLIESSDNIAEIRAAKEVATFYSEMENREQSERVRQLLERCRFEDGADVAVCILDSGVNNGHSLIQPVLSDSDLHTVRPEWGVNDHHGHGTLMAGTAVYGDLLALNNDNGMVRIAHRLESAKILPPPPEVNPKGLWGFITAQGIYRAEIQAPERKRIVCLAVTATEDRNRGRPSSWSGAVDELASGYLDGAKRFIVISAGNVDNRDNWLNYPNDNLTNEIHDPGQAWNALTVGAFTEKTRIADPKLSSYVPLAPSGGLSPFSTTSTMWFPRKWPIKPEVVFEGGNVARGPNNSIEASDDLKLLSTYHDPHVAQFAPFAATSAASAQAAWMAAQIQFQYPDAWPETIRALIVHSAGWTETMKLQFLRGESKSSYERLMKVCGYGVPNLEQALYCMSNSLTLISQAELQPFDKRVKEKEDAFGGKKKNTTYVTRDMHLYCLPWPTDVLRELGETQVTMRVTLSYFIEPGPGEVGWKNRYRYASHALRFDVNGPGESEIDFMQRINAQARDDDGESPGTAGAGQHWKIGEARNVGSIHSDIWEGRAADLAGSNKIAVYPAVGWWRERNHLGRWNRRCRYALVVSIYTPEQNVDIYTPVAVQVRSAIPIEIRTDRESAL